MILKFICWLLTCAFLVNFYLESCVYCFSPQLFYSLSFFRAPSTVQYEHGHWKCTKVRKVIWVRYTQLAEDIFAIWVIKLSLVKKMNVPLCQFEVTCIIFKQCSSNNKNWCVVEYINTFQNFYLSPTYL